MQSFTPNIFPFNDSYLIGDINHAAVFNIASENEARDVSPELLHWVWGMMLLTKQIGTYATSSYHQLQWKNTLIQLKHAVNEFKLPPQLFQTRQYRFCSLVWFIWKNKLPDRSQNNLCVKSCTSNSQHQAIEYFFYCKLRDQFIFPSDQRFHRQCSTSHWAKPVVPKLHWVGK